MIGTWTVAILLAAGRQDDAKPMKIGDFETDTIEWQAIKLDPAAGVGEDDEAKVAVTTEPAQVKAGKGSLSYSYDVVPNTIRMLALQRPLDLSRMKSLRLWVKCSKTTAIVFTVTETGGAGYQASFYCPQDAWQEVAVNLDELTPDEEGKDGNGKLDLDEVGSVSIIDISGFLSAFLPDLKGPRQMWLDEIEFSPRRVALTTGPTTVTRVTPVHLVDNFESPVIRWSPISVEFSDTPKFNLFDAPVAVDKTAPPDGGKQSLKYVYPRQGAKVYGIMRNVEKVDLKKAVALDIALKISNDGSVVVSLEEKDGSRYQKIVELKSDDGWKSLTFAFGDLTLADDSQDENGKLDAGDIKQISIADLTHLIGGGEVAENKLWIDEVRFVLSP